MEAEFNVDTVSATVAIILTGTEVQLAYITLMVKSRLIRATIERLQDSVDKREYSMLHANRVTIADRRRPCN